jgi:hypothetical protein
MNSFARTARLATLAALAVTLVGLTGCSSGINTLTAPTTPTRVGRYSFPIDDPSPVAPGPHAPAVVVGRGFGYVGG